MLHTYALRHRDHPAVSQCFVLFCFFIQILWYVGLPLIGRAGEFQSVFC